MDALRARAFAALHVTMGRLRDPEDALSPAALKEIVTLAALCGLPKLHVVDDWVAANRARRRAMETRRRAAELRGEAARLRRRRLAVVDGIDRTAIR